MQTRWIHINEAQLRDSAAQIMKKACQDVQILEPTLLQITENKLKFKREVNVDNARLDNSARGLGNCCGKTFFDIRITYLTSQSLP